MKIKKLPPLVLFIFIASTSFAQTIPTTQQASGQESLRQQQENEKKLRQHIEQKPAKQSIENVPEQPQEVPATNEQKITIKTIVITGNSILSQKELDAIILPYEGKDLIMREIQKLLGLLTDAYRKKGFITTRAVLPVQEIKNNILEIKVIQGLMGDLDVKGNRYFKKSLFTKRVGMKKGSLFNYDDLRNDLNVINQYPDRNVKTVLTPGKEPGQTDVLFQVKDRLPIHVNFSYDNFGSKYIGKNLYTGTASHDNLTGNDDILTFQYQKAEMDAYHLTSIRYLLPIGKSTEIGVYGSRNDLTLQEEFKALQARGKAAVYGIFANQTLLNKQDLKIVGSAGFDYKDIFNFQLGVESSRDRLRIPKIGLNIDYADHFYGRNIINNETSFGIPNIMGGMRDVDPRSSRAGAGALFTKHSIDLIRLQTLPLDSTLLLKSHIQLTGNVLPASEQFQLGGISNVRGFASGEAAGDSGESYTAELSFPFYLIPRSVPVPLSKAKLYDAFRIAMFYDAGHVHLRNPQAGEISDKNLDSLGWGMRLNLPEDFSVRLDFAWELTGRPSDSHNEHIWLQVSKGF